MPNWYILCVRSRHELSVREKLEDLEFEAMVPVQHRITKPSRHSKRRELTSSVLMFGYVFLSVEGPLPWWKLRDIPNVIGFLSMDGYEPYALRQDDISRLAAMSSIVAEDEDPDRPLRPGDMARIIDGPYRGKIIRVIDIVGRDAKWIGEMLGSRRTISTELSNLERT